MGSSGGAWMLAMAAAMLLAVSGASAAKYTVGDTSGWTTGADYTTWAGDKNVKVGDSLVFNYAGGAHTVAEVSAADYASCSAANVLSTDGSGTTTIALKTPGKHYFICGVAGHCSSGMKLVVDVAKASSPSPTPTTPKTPTTTPTATPPSSSGVTPVDTPTPPSSSGVTPVDTPTTVLAPPVKHAESGATGLTAVATLGVAGLVAAVQLGLF